MLPDPEHFLKKQNISVPLHCFFALEGGKKVGLFWLKAYGMHICALPHANTGIYPGKDGLVDYSSVICSKTLQAGGRYVRI